MTGRIGVYTNRPMPSAEASASMPPRARAIGLLPTPIFVALIPWDDAITAGRSFGRVEDNGQIYDQRRSTPPVLNKPQRVWPSHSALSACAALLAFRAHPSATG